MNVIAARHLTILGLMAVTAVPAVSAQDLFLPNDTTLNSTNPVSAPFSAIVGFANFDDYINGLNPTSPTIGIVAGANVNSLETHNSSIINMSGGRVGSGSFLGEILSGDNSVINITGGTVFNLDVQGNSTVNFSGGTVEDDIVTHDNSTANMSGGLVRQDLLINADSTFNLSGGHVLDDIFVQDNSILNIFGNNLKSTLLDPNFEGFYSEYVLSGDLLDRRDITGRIIFVQNLSGASFTLTDEPGAVPEPGILALLAGTACLGAPLLHMRKQKRN